MPDRWAEIEALLPAPVQGRCGRAFTAAMRAMLEERPVRSYIVQSAWDAPSAALPALVAERSLEEFIEPGMPEELVRRFISRAWELHSEKGFDSGVKLALGLIGVQVEIEQWHRLDPKGPYFTHAIVITGAEAAYPGEPALGPRQWGALQRLVEAVKRQSQATSFRLRRAPHRVPHRVGFARHVGRRARYAPVPVLTAEPMPLRFGFARRATQLRRYGLPVLGLGAQTGVHRIGFARRVTRRATYYAADAAPTPRTVYASDGQPVTSGGAYVEASA